MMAFLEECCSFSHYTVGCGEVTEGLCVYGSARLEKSGNKSTPKEGWETSVKNFH